MAVLCKAFWGGWLIPNDLHLLAKDIHRRLYLLTCTLWHMCIYWFRARIHYYTWTFTQDMGIRHITYVADAETSPSSWRCLTKTTTKLEAPWLFFFHRSLERQHVAVCFLREHSGVCYLTSPVWGWSASCRCNTLLHTVIWPTSSAGTWLWVCLTGRGCSATASWPESLTTTDIICPLSRQRMCVRCWWRRNYFVLFLVCLTRKPILSSKMSVRHLALYSALHTYSLSHIL